MKFATLVLSVSVLGSFAHADSIDDAFTKFGLNSDCENQVLTAVQKKCNKDSLKAEGKNRMNPCQDFNADISNQGQLEAGGYAGDADGYWYQISVIDAGKCQVKLSAEQ